MVSKSPSSLVVTVIIALLSLGVGLVIGYLLRPFPENSKEHKSLEGWINDVEGAGDDKLAALEMLRDCGQLAREDPVISKHLIESDVEACRALTCDIPYPRTYVIYKLRGEAIDLDGKLDEKAWKNVGWTDSFVDIQGRGLPSPRLETKVKMRYDDSFLFIGVFIEEPDIWANVSLHDGTVYQDNSFQILMDTRQSNVNYKEITINAKGIISDLMMTKAYVDSGEPLTFWESDVMSEVHIQGTLNNPKKQDEYWTIEMAIPFTAMYQGSGASLNRSAPEPGETWRANFLRAQWPIKNFGTYYEKLTDASTEWWVWQSPEVINVHLPERWGLLQFQDTAINSTRFQTSDRWITTNALLDTFAALKAFHAVTGRYTDKKELLHLPPYIVSGKCLADLSIELDWSGFKVTAKPLGKNKEEGHTRTDHFLWFGKEDMQYF
ncbi:hypothetical protein BgiMline_009451 [Biomphalaria glabrata]|uniref:Uncharacterized protein LOC106055940 n=1 Tax=Biomphalaria glabrata TaxID=6526 RepID=A0A2C9KB70_BIOGL|nr:uncharacterized protein LOC106055940 [Biomphalaria glabrata]XP_055879217.1 uncharacterized protein LOC106055940 [Biomphalaria glabrata]